LVGNAPVLRIAVARGFYQYRAWLIFLPRTGLGFLRQEQKHGHDCGRADKRRRENNRTRSGHNAQVNVKGRQIAIARRGLKLAIAQNRMRAIIV